MESAGQSHTSRNSAEWLAFIWSTKETVPRLNVYPSRFSWTVISESIMSSCILVGNLIPSYILTGVTFVAISAFDRVCNISPAVSFEF